MARGRKRCSGGVYAFWKWHGTRVGLCKAHSAQAHRAGWKMWPRTKTKKRNPAGGAIRLLRMGTSGKWEAVKRHRSLAHHDLAVAEAARLAMLPEHKDRYVYVAVQGPGHHEIARFGGVGRDPGPDDPLRKMRMHGGYPNPADPAAPRTIKVKLIGSDLPSPSGSPTPGAPEDYIVPEWGNLLAMIRAWKKYGHGRPSSIGVPETDARMPDAIGGWRWDVTGGGCTALFYETGGPGTPAGHKHYIQITEDAEVPTEMSTAVSLGDFYQEGGYIDWQILPQAGIPQAKRNPAANESWLAQYLVWPGNSDLEDLLHDYPLLAIDTPSGQVRVAELSERDLAALPEGSRVHSGDDPVVGPSQVIGALRKPVIGRPGSIAEMLSKLPSVAGVYAPAPSRGHFTARRRHTRTNPWGERSEASNFILTPRGRKLMEHYQTKTAPGPKDRQKLEHLRYAQMGTQPTVWSGALWESFLQAGYVEPKSENPVSGYEPDVTARREAFWEGDEEPA
jgi:hypothetical protein